MLGHTVQGEIASNEGIGRLLGNRFCHKCGRRDLGGVEKVWAFQVPGQTIIIGIDRVHIYDDLVASFHEFSVRCPQFAGKFCKSAVVAAGDL